MRFPVYLYSLTGIMAIATGFIEERQKGIYRRLSLATIKKHTIIASQITHRYAVMIIQTLLIIIIGYWYLMSVLLVITYNYGW